MFNLNREVSAHDQTVSSFIDLDTKDKRLGEGLGKMIIQLSHCRVGQ